MEENKKKKIGILIGLGGFILLITIFIVIGIFNNKDEEYYETEQVTAYSNRMQEVIKTAKTMGDVEEAKSFVVSEIYDANELYGGNKSVDFMSNQMLVSTMTDKSNDLNSFIFTLNSSLDKVLNDVNNGIDNLLDNDENILKSTLTMSSKTVCDDQNIDNKYCVDKLSARVYVVDKDSDKWVVLVHGNMMSGSLMYSAVGNMYTDEGYNVIAPDLRGFGSSDGSVAMGYLESLDIYDWIKDLNNNWKSRYGVTTAPKTIVVHGISLGGATTLQLATNPDIASASAEPYTHNLSSLNVKGFVDDCGYTSMSGIITEMLTMGDILDLTSMLGSLNIDLEQFMGEFNNIAEYQKIPGFENFDLSNFENADFSKIYSNLVQFSGEFSKLQNELNKYINNNGNYEIPGMNQSVINDILSESINYVSDEETRNKFQNMMKNYFPEEYKEKFGDINKDSIEDLINNYGGIGQNTNNVVRLNSSSNDEQVLEGLIAKVLINLVGVGLNENNYAKYSDVFSSGRKFVEGSKVMVIHGTADTTVPHSNAEIVAKNIKPGILVHKWDVQNQPHAFVVVGIKKDEYKSLVSKYLQCINNNTCSSISE